jgi:uncharacterized protein involved in response to NO
MSATPNPSFAAGARWQVFTAAPHRMMFFGGAVQLVATMSLWLVELVGRHTPLWGPLHMTIPSTWAHAFLMLYALFGFFMFGFLMTTYPRWMNGPLVPQQAYTRTFLLMASGAAVFYVGLFASERLAAVGVVLLLAGWGIGLGALYQVFRRAPALDKTYETVLNVALAAGWLGALSFLLWLLSGNFWFLRIALYAGLWLFLVPVVATVGHRMIPFFSSCVLQGYRVVQPRWSLLVLAAGVVGHFALELVGAYRWLFVVDVPLFLVALYLTWSWGFRRSFEVRLLAVLHIAFLWLTIGLALYSAQSLILLLSGEFVLGRAPLHAIAIGFIAGMTVAMASRVTLGHSGRPLVADDFTWACFLALNATAVLRIAAEWHALSAALGVSLNVVAAAVWLACIAPWVIRYGRMYLRPRADGKPG